jgi:predicted acyltransferase
LVCCSESPSAYCGASLLFIWLRPRALIATCIALLLGYWALLELFPVPGFGAGDYAEGHNLTNYLDKMYLGGRRYDVDHDPEGNSQHVAGDCLVPARCLRRTLVARIQQPWAAKLSGLRSLGAVALGLGWAWAPWFPVIKKLWTSSFRARGCGLDCPLPQRVLLDHRSARLAPLGTPFVWIGLNPITIYIAGNVIEWPKIAARFTGGDLQKWMNESLHVAAGDLLTAVIAVSFSFLLAWFLHRRPDLPPRLDRFAASVPERLEVRVALAFFRIAAFILIATSMQCLAALRSPSCAS